jgi:DNA-binding FadR family transcriptional regulator
MSIKKEESFLTYLAGFQNGDDDPDRIPPLGELSKQMGVSIAKLREQMEVARRFGLIDVRPRVGIRRKPYRFFPAVNESLLFAIAYNRDYFKDFSELRVRVESAFWFDAVALLTTEDHEKLQDLMTKAWEKLHGNPIMIPHREHRELHMTVFSRLENTFVEGIIASYWEAYEAVELDAYTEYDYLQEVWTHHQDMVDAICRGKVAESLAIYKAHTDLLRHRPPQILKSMNTPAGN